jgi:hypothetical protein
MSNDAAITPKACFTRFWKLLSAPGPEIWREYRAAAQGPERQREALELLASVVWHLELSASLAPWPIEKMEEYYSQLLSRQTDALTPWKTWVDHYDEVKVTSSPTRILMNYSLRGRADIAAYAVQNTLIADAAMRLDSTRQVLRTISNKTSLVLLERRDLESRLQSSHVPRIVTATAIVVAFRDAYLHAEISDKQKRSLASFRQTLSGRYSLNDVGMAGLRVWLELYKLCMRSIREDKAKTG